MAISDATRRALRELGLTEYETRAYLTLITYGVLTASQVSENAIVPYSKIYDVLVSLEKKGWIESKSGRPSRYYPKPPLEALEAVKLRLESTIKDCEQQVLSELQPIYEKKEVRERPDIWIIRGEFNVLAKLQEILSKTKIELMIAAPIISDALAATFTPALVHLKNVGVKTMIMTTKTTDNKLLRASEAAEVRIRDQMFGGGIISDEREVLLILGEEEKPVLAIWSNHIGLTKFARNYFEFLWQTSGVIKHK
jgi:sugar-specific transcriptional regulator TrmB